MRTPGEDMADDEMTDGHPAARPSVRAVADPERFTGPLSATFPLEVPDGETVVYGPDLPDEGELRLLGNVEGRRILELGVGNGRNAVALARRGARVIGVDPSPERLASARRLAEAAEVRIELHQGDPGDIAFVRADTVDLVLSVFALAGVADIDRVFRQVHRVLRPECSLVVSLPHPAWQLIDAASADPSRLARSWFERTPEEWTHAKLRGIEYRRSFAELIGGLHRSSFRVDAALEPEPDLDARVRSPWWNEVMRRVPATLILRARKEGV
ncbi:MAG: class I SAM-dependent methyltransferase [Acidimicrobiia bacterium]|nr:class I SAM-dependent methyltransferase [Acidimicrobiia bacterium]